MRKRLGPSRLQHRSGSGVPGFSRREFILSERRENPRAPLPRSLCCLNPCDETSVAARDGRLDRQRAEARAAYRILQFAYRHGITAAEAEEILAKAGNDEGRAEQLAVELKQRKLEGDREG